MLACINICLINACSIKSTLLLWWDYTEIYYSPIIRSITKATNYKLFISHPGETMKSMWMGGYYYYYYYLEYYYCTIQH